MVRTKMDILQTLRTMWYGPKCKEMIDHTAELICDKIPKSKCGLLVVLYFISMHNLKFKEDE